jgi:hypothetical protein
MRARHNTAEAHRVTVTGEGITSQVNADLRIDKDAQGISKLTYTVLEDRSHPEAVRRFRQLIQQDGWSFNLFHRPPPFNWSIGKLT